MAIDYHNFTKQLLSVHIPDSSDCPQTLKTESESGVNIQSIFLATGKISCLTFCVFKAFFCCIDRLSLNSAFPNLYLDFWVLGTWDSGLSIYSPVFPVCQGAGPGVV